jgi:hypothetical protein
MKRLFTQAWSVLLAVTALSTARAQAPSAEEILRAARENPMSQQAKLDARLVNDDVRIPFTITLDHGVVSYIFQKPDQTIQLVLGENGSELRERIGGKVATVPPARLAEKVRGTPITYEDLALRMLYWPNPKLLGDDVIRTRSTWKLEMQAPRGQSQYGAARVWIDKESGAVLQIEGYDRNGFLKKRFEMTTAQKIDGKWMLRTMRVETHDPKTQKTTDLIWLKIVGDAKS